MGPDKCRTTAVTASWVNTAGARYGLLHAPHVVHPADSLLVERHNGALRLVLHGSGDMALHSQMRQELPELLSAYRTRLPFTVKEDEAFQPTLRGFLGM